MMANESLIDFLVIDDDDTYRARLVKAFIDRGFQAKGASSGNEALQTMASPNPFKVVLDLKLESESGIDLIPALLSQNPLSKIVVLTGYGSIATAIEAMRRGATHYLTKPIDTDSIVSAFEQQSQQPLPQKPASLERVEWEHLQRVLTDNGGNITLTAKALKMHRRSLQRKLSKFPPN